MALPEAVIFDMDGLMLDTETISMNAMSRTLRMHKIEFDEQWLFDIIGMNGNGAKRYLTGKLGFPIPEAVDATFIDTYQKHITEKGIELKSGLVELFGFLKENDVKRAVATSTRSLMAHKKLAMTGINHWFETVTCGDEVENGKPAPDIYLKAAKSISLPPENCLALEDSDNGAKAAHAAGIDVIVVPDLKQPKDHTRGIAFSVVNDLHEVTAHLRAL